MSLPNQISLVAEDGTYLSLPHITAPGFYTTTIGDDERLTLHDLGDGKVSLQNRYGLYLVEWNSILTSQREDENSTINKIFTLEDRGTGRVALRGENGRYVGFLGSSGRSPHCNSGPGDRFATFGLIDQTQGATPAPLDPPGTPLIAACSLNGAEQLLVYSPQNGLVYRSPIAAGGIGDLVLMNRNQPCKIGGSSIAVVRHDNRMYLILYHRTERTVTAYPLDLPGLGRAALLPSPIVTNAAQIGATGGGGVTTLLFFSSGKMQHARFLLGYSVPGWSPPIDAEINLRPGWMVSVPAGAQGFSRIGYSPSTGEVGLMGAVSVDDYKPVGVVEHTFSQLASILAADGTGLLFFLRAGTTELTRYRITGTGLAEKEIFSLPKLRPPTLRLHAVDSGQLVSVGPDQTVKLCPDTQIDRSSQLEMLPDPSGSFRLRTYDNTLLCVDGNGAFRTCPDSPRDGTSLFTMVPQPGARFCLRTAGGRRVWVDSVALKTGIDSELDQQGLFAQSLFEWNDYGIGGGDSYVDSVLGQPVTPAVFPDLVPVRSEYSAQADCYSFSTRSANSASVDGFAQRETIFLAYSSRVGGTVPVYLEQQVKGQPGHHLSIRDAAKAAQWGYRQLGIAFYAYATQQPGTVAIHRESKSGTGGTQYYFSTRSASEAAAQGFRQEGVAFYAHAPLIPVNSSRGSSPNRFYFSLSGASVPAGFTPHDTVFCAHSVQALGTVPVYLEQVVRGEGAYHLSTRSAAAAAQWGYKQLGIAFYAYATQQPGTVPVYRERPAGASGSQYYFSTRSADEAAAAGAKQLGIAFYAFLPGAYVVARTQLIDTALGSDQAAKPTYRIVLDCRSITGQPIQTALTLRTTAAVSLKLEDGSTIVIGPDQPITRSTSADGQLSLLLEPGQSLVVPVLKVKADFMSGTQALAIAPDQNAHRALSRLDSATLQPLLGSRSALVKQVMGVLADSAPIAVAPTANAPVAFGLFDDAVKAVGNFFSHTIPSAAKDGARAVSQAVQPVAQAIQQSVPALISGVNQAVAPGGAVMVSVQGASSQVQAVISRGEVAASAIAQQLQTGASVVVSFTTAIIHEAGSLGERAFNAFLIDAGAAGKLLIASAQEAAQLVVKLVEQVGKALSDLLLLVTSRFSWDNILVTHSGINHLMDHMLHKMESSIDTMLGRGKDFIVGKIHGLGAQLDASFDGFMDSLPTPLIKGPLPALDSPIEHFLSLLKKGMGQAGLPSALPPAPTNPDLTTGLANLQPSLTPPPDSYLRNLPADPMVILNEGPRLFFQAVRSLINGALSGVAELIGNVFDSLSAMLHDTISFVRLLINAAISIPVITPFYEQVLMKGNGTKLTLSSLLSLFAALILEGSHQVAAGVKRPFFSPAIADQLQGGPAISFSDVDDQTKAAARRTIPAVSAALRGILAIYHGITLFEYKGPSSKDSELKSLAIHFLSTVALGVAAWWDWSMRRDSGAEGERRELSEAEERAIDWSLGIWFGGFVWTAFLRIGIEVGGYARWKGMFELVAFLPRMIVWGLRNEGASPLKLVANALDGVSNVIQTIGGVFKMKESMTEGDDAPADAQRMAARKQEAATDFLRAGFLFGLAATESARLAQSGLNADPE